MTLRTDGWTLVSAEERHASSPDSFEIPPRAERESLAPGSGVKLLFDIEVREHDRVRDRGVERLWVIVKARAESRRYIGVLDSTPVLNTPNLRSGDTLHFGPEHIAAIDNPSRDYVIAKYGAGFFDSDR